MRYLNEADLELIGVDWEALVQVIRSAAGAYAGGECAQPIKPYLKFGDARNRIIAMPAYVSQPLRTAGLKWIASYPGNIAAGLPRAHSVTVLNDPDSGVPTAFIKGSYISAIRTAAVSGALLGSLLEAKLHRERVPLEAAIIGMGPIGRTHARMLNALFGSERISRIRVYDNRDIGCSDWLSEDEARGDGAIPIERVAAWEEAYRSADIVFTCTAAPERYINEPPKPGSILMHVSLRDYTPAALEGAGAVIVDSWEEVCRADTDIERLHQARHLEEKQTVALADALKRPDSALAGMSGDGFVLFAPMGLAVFDVAIAAYYAAEAERMGIGKLLD
ncbi:2,3-diaminopropionate biosynthesis protein SbnB [Paenibacillus sp. NEAU-GSW1]|uniref:2,3-diaminopropionate biosynthesis protein SbnB n=1 Tax=Paenibacillus sp. NEAU-GSW1 TaxID=2682486 RepID=UPI0012E2F206|nr:2,3-diaminopropionate biosynthesis protein SbnB [Paenibacillus sp. NEAU-GSW1]MUT67801.1 2,3-diaminopropionate biosynthesis protein SbnB [Paenibacillus sp. NEAU-GSW1]